MTRIDFYLQRPSQNNFFLSFILPRDGFNGFSDSFPRYIPEEFSGTIAGIPFSGTLSSLAINRMYRLVSSISSLVVNKRIFFGYVSSGKSLALGRLPRCSRTGEIAIRGTPLPENRILPIRSNIPRLSPGSWEEYIQSDFTAHCNLTPQ